MLQDRPLHTFISYSRVNQQFAIRLASELKSSGFSIWMDQFDISTGARWDDEIEKALHECQIFLFIMTPASIASENAKDEMGYAIDHDKYILPVLLEECEVPFRLRRLQYVDFTRLNFNEGIRSAKDLLSKLVQEIENSKLETANKVDDTIIPAKATSISNEPKTVPTKKRLSLQQFQPGRKEPTRITQYQKRTSLILAVGIGLFAIGALIVAVLFLKPLFFAFPSRLSPTSTTVPTQTIIPTFTAEPTVITATQPSENPHSFVEEFDAESRWTSDWKLQLRHGDPNKQKSFQSKISDGDLIFDLTNEYVWGYFLYDSSVNYNNVEMEAVVAGLKPKGTFGLICQFSDQGWYEFDVNGDGTYSVRFVDNLDSEHDEERYVIRAGAIPGFKYSIDESRENIIRIRCNGNNLSLSVNNTELLNGYPGRYVLEQGGIGFAVRSYEKYPVHVILKSVTVREP